MFQSMKFVAEFGITCGHEKRILKGRGIKMWQPGSLSVGRQPGALDAKAKDANTPCVEVFAPPS
jgi:hypothetical protein